MGILLEILRSRPIFKQFFALEVTENYIHIPIENKSKFAKKTFRTVTLSEDKGIKAIMGKYRQAAKPKDRMHIQKYLFSLDKGWTKATAKAWVKKNKPTSRRRRKKRRRR